METKFGDWTLKRWSNAGLECAGDGFRKSKYDYRVYAPGKDQPVEIFETKKEAVHFINVQRGLKKLDGRSTEERRADALAEKYPAFRSSSPQIDKPARPQYTDDRQFNASFNAAAALLNMSRAVLSKIDFAELCDAVAERAEQLKKEDR